MKSRIIVLMISIIIALIVLGIGIFGLSSADNDNQKKTSSGELENLTDLNNDSNDESEMLNESEEIKNIEEETSSLKNDVPTTVIPVSGEIDPNKPMVALTFDDGPAGENTLKILEALEKYNAHATFFVVGYNMDGNEDIIKKIAEQGSEVANHTASHKDLATLGVDEINYEVNYVADKIKSLTGQKSVVIRPPYGSTNDLVMSTLTEPIVLWSIDTEDWKTRDSEATLTHVKETIFDGAIILMHDLHAETAEATVKLVEWLNSQGYQMVTVSEMGYYRRGGLQTGVRYGSLQP